MTSRFSKAAIFGILIGITGLAFGLFSFGLDLEESIGLPLLFKLRGVKRPPSDVVIVSIDKVSADHLNLPYDTRKWPRTLHARLIEKLAKEGASVIAFDMYFDETRSVEEDRALARALKEAGNVVICERLRSDKVSVRKEGGSRPGDVRIVKLTPPVPPVAEGAAALAPFPLPKVPVRVSQYWTFTTGAGETPTLPVVAMQILSTPVYDEFTHLLEKASRYPFEKTFLDRRGLLTSGNVEKAISVIRNVFQKEPGTGERMLDDMAKSGTLSRDPVRRHMLTSLTEMYRDPDSLYLNFYGPPGTVTTVPFYQVIQAEDGAGSDQSHPDMRGKVVFVGLSELLEFEQKDGFYTVFSQEDGRDISGAEIAATAFANLWEDMPVRPLSAVASVGIIFLWGLAIGMSCRLLSTPMAALGVIATGILYLILAGYQFRSAGRWYPVFSPLFVQTTLGFFGAVLWKYFDANRERQNIKKAFGYYLPAEMVDSLAKNISDLSAGSKLVHGICLCTDVEHYSSLAESLDPEELGRYMNKYYETVFGPVRHHGGLISDVIGDSMMALWVSVEPDAVLRDKACRAALDIDRSVLQFNRVHEGRQLHTRIGVHTGPIFLGNVGGVDHFEYRPVGDIVNTAARIEGLNKHLGTRILVSDEVLAQIDGLLTRGIGAFLLVGKKKPLVVHELVCPLLEADALLRGRCVLFEDALCRFREQRWEEAAESFHQLLRESGEDGPSRFYLNLCERYRKNPPREPWDGVIQMEEK